MNLKNKKVISIIALNDFSNGINDLNFRKKIQYISNYYDVVIHCNLDKENKFIDNRIKMQFINAMDKNKIKYAQLYKNKEVEIFSYIRKKNNKHSSKKRILIQLTKISKKIIVIINEKHLLKKDVDQLQRINNHFGGIIKVWNDLS